MQKLFITSLVLLISGFSFAQETKKDTLKTEEIVVVKPYTPTISAAFKIKSNPSIESASNIEKEKVNYSIFSIPVASTFTPSKGKAKGVVREPTPFEELRGVKASIGPGSDHHLRSSRAFRRHRESCCRGGRAERGSPRVDSGRRWSPGAVWGTPRLRPTRIGG